MDPALWAAKTGLDAQQTRMTVVSHNLANVNTTGFKKDRAIFEDLLYQNQKQVGGATSQDTAAPTGLNIGTGVRVVATEKNHTQGTLNTTGNSLDVAIQGRGFFQVLMPDGSFGYTRDGSFKMSAQGELVTASGYKVQPGITIPSGAQSITIGNDGVVSALVSGQSAPTQIGTLQQGSLEGSNVNVVEELVNMIETQRAYEMNSKAISTTDQMLSFASNNM